MGRRSTPTHLLCVFAVLSASCFLSCAAQKSAFQWKFTGNSFSTNLVECQSYPLLVQNRSNTNASALGTPPYYMIAFKPSGIPTTSFIGSNPTNLSWTVNQPAGSSLLLGVIDSAGNSGGQPPSLYTVQSGSSTSCLPPAPKTNITIAANLTSTVTTCDAMGFQFFGGKKPYNITLAAPNSTVLTNVTMGPTDDVFTYVDRADPNSGLLVAVVDADGNWGTGTEMFATKGPVVTDDSCKGLVSSSGNSSFVNLHPKQPSKGLSGGAIAGIIIPIVLVAVLAVLGFLYWRFRLQRNFREPEPAFLPDAWVGPSHTPGMMMHETGSGFSPYADSPGHPESKAMMAYREQQLASGSQIGMSLLSPRPDMRSMTSSGSYHDATSSSEGASSAKQRLPPGVPQSWGIQREGDIVIQHSDGGAVQEIPPPYIDRSAGGSGAASGSGGAGPSAGPGGSGSGNAAAGSSGSYLLS